MKSIYDKDADMQHVIESRKLHIEEIKRRPDFNDDFKLQREAEIGTCEDDISHAKFRLNNKI